MQENKDRFIELMSRVEREGISDLMQWLEASDFYRAPASTRFHGSYEGGLLEHSLNVYDEAVRILSAYPEIDVPEEALILSTLLHDACKINMYAVEKRWRKDDDNIWEQYDTYKHEEKLNYGGHGSKSVFVISHFIKLTTLESVAINCHMSSWDGNMSVGNAFTQFPFAWIVHVADESATYMREGNQ